MQELALSPKARRHLRALGHHLRPVVMVGKEGLGEALFAATRAALEDHELIKVKLGENADGERQALAAELAHATCAELVGVTGRILLLYRRRPADKRKKGAKPSLALPGERKAGKPRRPSRSD